MEADNLDEQQKKKRKKTTGAQTQAQSTPFFEPCNPPGSEEDYISCDFCDSEKKLRALKSCLQCVASYCEQHLQPHYHSEAFKKHKLIEPCKNLHDNLCSRHDEVLKVFCRTDQKPICLLCAMDGHEGHEMVPTTKERCERQKELEASRGNIHRGVQDREREVGELKKKTKAINGSADRAVQQSKETFADMIRALQTKSSEVEQTIRSKQETEVRQVKELQQKLEQEIFALKKRDEELQQLAQTEDHNQFLQSYTSTSTSTSLSPQKSNYTHSPSFATTQITPAGDFEDVTAAVIEARDNLQDILTLTCTKISQPVVQINVLQSLPQPQPKDRADFLRYSQEITLDPNTAYPELSFSDGNRKVRRTFETYEGRYSGVAQSYPSEPGKFTDYAQVLSTQSLTGRCYFEVKRSGYKYRFAVAYKNTTRAGDKSFFGYDGKSWSLHCDTGHYYYYHSNRSTLYSNENKSPVIGIYLDHSEGILSFYGVDESKMTLLHSVKTKFKQPLHAGVWLHCPEHTAEFIELK